MKNNELKISRKLSNLDFNANVEKMVLYTHWCRVAFSRFEKWNYNEHAHLFWELHLCLCGSAKVLIDEIEYTLTENTYIVLSPKCKHKFIFVSEDYSEFVWGFGINNNDEIDEYLCNQYKDIKIFNAKKEILDCVKLIWENVENCDFGYYHIITNVLYHIFIILARDVGANEYPSEQMQKSNTYMLIKRYIYENLSVDVNIEDAAVFLGVSKNFIERSLKREKDKTFSQVKREMKAEAICELLRETEYSMEEIADITGFADRYSMGKFFKKISGETPGRYKKGIGK